MGNQKLKTKVMNKQDPNFIKERMNEYVNKVAHHHYQHSANAEKPGSRVIFVPFFKEHEAVMLKVHINSDDKVSSIETEKCSSKRCFKGQLFHIWRSPYQTLTSVKKYKRYVEIENKVKALLKENYDQFYEAFDNYSERRKLVSKFVEQLQ